MGSALSRGPPISQLEHLLFLVLWNVCVCVGKGHLPSVTIRRSTVRLETCALSVGNSAYVISRIPMGVFRTTYMTFDCPNAFSVRPQKCVLSLPNTLHVPA